MIQTSLHQPFLFVWSETSDTHEAHYQQALKDVSAIYDHLKTGYQVTIKDTRHFNFTDYAVEFSPVLKLVNMLGPIDGKRGLHISSAYVLAFFDTYLKGIGSPLLQGSSADYPEVKFEAHVK